MEELTLQELATSSLFDQDVYQAIDIKNSRQTPPGGGLRTGGAIFLGKAEERLAQ